MKKAGLMSLGLIAIDQMVKLVIFRLAMGVDAVIVPGVLYFHPVQNRNLNWVASMAGFITPVWLMVVFQVFVLVLVTLACRYFIFESGSRQRGLLYFYAFIVAGIGCSFIDVVFWGGSLDFAGLFDWFVFDVKDIYLNASCVFLIVWVTKREKERSHLPKGEGERGMFTRWLKAGCPAQKQE